MRQVVIYMYILLIDIFRRNAYFLSIFPAGAAGDFNIDLKRVHVRNILIIFDDKTTLLQTVLVAGPLKKTLFCAFPYFLVIKLLNLLWLWYAIFFRMIVVLKKTEQVEDTKAYQRDHMQTKLNEQFKKNWKLNWLKIDWHCYKLFALNQRMYRIWYTFSFIFCSK